MNKLPNDRPPLTDEDGEVRELTEEDFRHFRRLRKGQAEMIEAMSRLRARDAGSTEHVDLQLDRNVIDHFRATGPGWQSRINAVLAEHVKIATR